jgi:hypothetical protein
VDDRDLIGPRSGGVDLARALRELTVFSNRGDRAEIESSSNLASSSNLGGLQQVFGAAVSLCPDPSLD